MVAAPYNCLSVVCKRHSFWISFDRVSGNESADEIPGIYLVEVKAVIHIVDNTKSAFQVDSSVSTDSSKKRLVQVELSTHIFDPNW